MAGSGRAQLRDGEEVLLRVEGVVVEHRVRGRGVVHAVSDVSFDVKAGETLGLVGESGCGKSSLGRAILAYPPPTAGSVRFDGEELTTLSARELRRARAKLQVIFQDPRSSLNPRRKIGQIVTEGPAIWGRTEAAAELADEMLAAVGLDPDGVRDRRPHEFSGGQCQRIAIARALMLEPKLLVCDEPVSALDVSVQAKILNLLEEMKARYDLTLLFVAHDLAVVKSISDRVAVMYLGKLCELAPAEQLYASPAHPYTQALLEAVPAPDPDVELEPMEIRGELPSPLHPPSGCRFRTRCPLATELCATQEPQMRDIGDGHFVACHAVPEAPALAPPGPPAGAVSRG
jgi:peptide/nickel transport system ATP-binding protein